MNSELTMNAKNYTTPEQRDSLLSVGIGHVKGRSFEEAEALIDQQIRLGNLAPEHKDRASFRQLEKLDELELEYEPMISKKEASDLISRYESATDRQKEYLVAMGVSFDADITKSDASSLIDENIGTKKMTNYQADMITRLGGYVDKSMTVEQASNFIQELIDSRGRCNRCFGEYNYRDNRCECGAFVPKRGVIFPDNHRDRVPFIEQVLRFFGLV